MHQESPVAEAPAAEPVRVLVIGAGVIGSVYAGRLIQAGHHVVMLARGQRLADLRAHGLVLEDAGSGPRTQLSVPAVDTAGIGRALRPSATAGPRPTK